MPESLERKKLHLKQQPVCEICGAKYGLEIHHRTHENLHSEQLEDLQVLCHECHASEHGDAQEISYSRFIGFLTKAKRLKKWLIQI